MAGDEPMGIIRIKVSYSFKEAIDYMKIKNRQPGSRSITYWLDVKTGKEVIIGYTDQP